METPAKGTVVFKSATSNPVEVGTKVAPSTSVDKVPTTTTVTDLRVSEILNTFVKALSRLDSVTERINKFCDNADSELD